MKGLFVTGTDTNVGKTLVATLLCQGFAKVIPTAYFKPIQCGEPKDTDTVATFAGSSVKIKESTYFLQAPMSPNRAAQLENIAIDLDKILVEGLEESEQFYIVEGAGGVAVPISSNQSMLDVMSGLQLPAIVVASTRLGTINHTVLTVKALQQKGISCLGIVLNGEPDEGLSETLEEATSVPVLFHVPPWGEITPAIIENFTNTNLEFLGFVDRALGRRQNNENSKWEERDRAHVWHPFTQHGIVKDHPVVERGHGSYLYFNNQKVIDGISSWWVNIFGHCHPTLSAVVAQQSHELEHVIFAGFSHHPAIQLADNLVQLTNQRDCRLSKVFYSDNGSTSVEVALKMAYQYCQQSGESHKNRFLALKGSYHGDTLGAMSVGERDGFNKVFNPLMFPVDFVDPFDLRELEEAFADFGSRYAAVIVEPMVQGSSGMRMHSAEFLNRLATLAREHNTLVICDEVFTGFYRTGKMFAFEHSNLRPDLLCLSKGLTGGYLPLGVTMASQTLYDCFNREDLQAAFLHGHSYTANPISCRVACTTLNLLQQPEWQNAISQIITMTSQCLRELENNGKLFNLRQLGTIGAMEIGSKKSNYFRGSFSYDFHKKALAKGVLLRPLGSTVYAVPPYCISEKDLKRVYLTIEQLVNEEL